MMTRAAGPAARRLAHEHGLDLQRVHGRGRRGCITVEDVKQATSVPSTDSLVTARADLSDLLDRLPALAELSRREEPPLTPLLIKAAAVALRASPYLAPLHVAKGAERWALDHDAVVGKLGIAALTRGAAVAQLAPSVEVTPRYGASLRLDGPLTASAYKDGAIRSRSHLHITVEGYGEAPAAPFIRMLVELLETPVLLLSA